jgi:hypothetical protein
MGGHIHRCQELAANLGSQIRLVATGSPIIFLYGIVLLGLTSWLLIRTIQFLKKPSYDRPATPDLEKPASRIFKAPARTPGGLYHYVTGFAAADGLKVWEPVDFKRPTAPPAPEWNVYTSKPKPYRPFRHGTYHITMGLRNMDWDEWIGETCSSRVTAEPSTNRSTELDNHYMKFHADKANRIIERSSKCSRTDPVAFDGAIELLEEFCGYLPERYPSLYRRTAVGMDNLVTGEVFNIVERPLIEDPMQMAGRMVQDDLAIMFEKEDGQYYLLAGSILLAGFWKLEDKFGMPLSEIHTSGDVPGFKQKLEKGMMNFFRRVQPNGPVQRVRPLSRQVTATCIN